MSSHETVTSPAFSEMLVFTCWASLRSTFSHVWAEARLFNSVSGFTQNCCVQAGAVFFRFQLVWRASYFARMIRHVCGMCYLFRRMLYKAVGAMKLLTCSSENTCEVNQNESAHRNILSWILFQQTSLSQKRTLNDRKCEGMTRRGKGEGKAPKSHMNISIRSLFAVWNLWQALENNRNKYSLSTRGGFSWRSRKRQQKAEKWNNSVPLDCTFVSNLSTLYRQLREKGQRRQKERLERK